MGWVSQVTCPWTCGLPRPKLVLLTRKPSLRALAGRRDPSPRQGLAFSSLRRPLWLSWPHQSSWPKPAAAVTRGETAGGPSAQRGRKPSGGSSRLEREDRI